MAFIVPTLTAETAEDYHNQIDRIGSITNHVHLDLMDGKFAPSKSLNLENIWLPENITCDVHIMYQVPQEIIQELFKLSIRVVVVHAESQMNFEKVKRILKEKNIQIGIAVLPETSIASVEKYIQQADHALIFSGNLGYQGGSTANLKLLDRIPEIKLINPTIEIGWDGGVDSQNVKLISEAGVDVINSGGFIHNSDDPARQFHILQELAK